MARYYFNIALPGRLIIDATGKECADLEAAHWHAVRLAYQARQHLDDDEAWTIQIADRSGFTQEVFVPCFRTLASKKHVKKSLTIQGYSGRRSRV